MDKIKSSLHGKPNRHREFNAILLNHTRNLRRSILLGFLLAHFSIPVQAGKTCHEILLNDSNGGISLLSPEVGLIAGVKISDFLLDGYDWNADQDNVYYYDRVTNAALTFSKAAWMSL